MRHRAFTAAALLLLFAAPAHAQEAVVEGAGVEIGENTVLHPSVGVETGVISNIFYEDINQDTAPVLRLLARFAIASAQNRPEGLVKPPTAAIEDPTGAPDDIERAAPTLDFRMSGHLTYDQYVHPDIEVTEQSSLSGGLDLHLLAWPQGTVSFFVDDRTERDTRPRNFESIGNLNRWINHLQLGTRWQPGRGALDLSLRYENLVDYFESSGSSFANRMNHLLRGRAEWQFLPITRLFLDASYGFYGPLAGMSEKPSSTPLRVQLGIASAITERTSVRSHIGFGKGFYAVGPDFTNVLFGAEVGWRYSPLGRVTAAYQYGFDDSINANFYRDHALVARVDQQLAMFLLNATAELRLRGYRGVFASIGPPTRDDLIMRVRARAHYLYRDWLAFTGELDMVSDATNYIDALGDDPSYNRFELVIGGVAAF